jgi:hypothetical protein
MEMNLNNKGIYNGENRQISLDQFIGIFPNAISDDLCSDFVNYFNAISEQGLTMSTMEESGTPRILRKDEVIHIPRGLPVQCFPEGLCKSLWKNISECFNIYSIEYTIARPMTCHHFKAHRVQPSGGYHIWHHEQDYTSPYRALAWHLNLEVPKMGGETEFLFQSMRVEPKVGQLAIWPAGFTHKHRGNPPLEGQKTYLTGWFSLVEPPQQQ